MPTKNISVSCSDCGFPISAKIGQIVNCPNCGISGKVSSSPLSPAWIIAGLAFIAGVTIGVIVKANPVSRR